MASYKKRTSGSISRKKRCPKGSRKDKITGSCIKYIGFSVFDELKDAEISEKGKTLSLENLSGDGAILKLYQDGNIIGQQLVEDKHIKKAKERTEKDMMHIFKIIRKIEKNPNLIETDKKFQRFKKRQEKKMEEKKGGTTGSEGVKKDSIKVLVQKDVVDQMVDPDIKDLQKNIDEIQRKISVIHDSMHQNWWSQFAIFNLFEIASVPLATAIGTYHVSNTAITVGSNLIQTPLTLISNTLWYDFYGAAGLLILDILQCLFPNSNTATMNIIAQYVYWTWVITSTTFNLVPIYWAWSILSVIPAAGILATVTQTPETAKLAELERELREAKKELAEKLEKKAQ